MKKNQLIEFIEQHEALNISEIANKAGFSRTLLYGILSGEKALLGDKAWELAKVLSHYGLILRGWTFKPFEADESPLMLECYRFVKDAEQEIIEETIFNEQGIETGCIIRYKVLIQKTSMDQFDFAEFLGISY